MLCKSTTFIRVVLPCWDCPYKIKERLNLIHNPKLIKLDSTIFFFTEEPVIMESPVDHYYMKVYDLSINLRIKLKWVLYGYYFFACISEEVTSINPEYTTRRLLSTSINADLVLPQKKHQILLDDSIIVDVDELDRRLSGVYNNAFFEENSVAHLKLKINVGEYLLLQNAAFPHLGYYE